MSTEIIEIEGFQLSPQQSRVGALQGAGDDTTYRAHCAIVAEGNVAPTALKKALEEVVRRHEILRTTFRRLPGVEIPLQVIGDGGVSWAADEDWSESSPTEQERRLATLLQQAHAQRLDLEADPTLHACLLTFSPRKRVLVVILPALCADAGTLKNLIREISREITTPAGRRS